MLDLFRNAFTALSPVSKSARTSSVVTIRCPDGIDGPSHVVNIGIFKASDTWTTASTSRMWLRNLLPRPSARGSLDQTSDVDKLDCGRDQRRDFGDFGELLEAGVGHRNDAQVRFYRAKGVVLRRRFVRASDRVEEGDLPTLEGR